MGAPTKPTAVAVPVTNPTRESEGRGRMGQGGTVEKTSWEKSNSEIMSFPLKVTTGAMILFC